MKEWFNTSKYLINTRKIKFEDEKILADSKGKSKKSKKKKITRRESSISPKNIITYEQNVFNWYFLLLNHNLCITNKDKTKVTTHKPGFYIKSSTF